MAEASGQDDKIKRAVEEQARAELKALFEAFRHEVPIYLFTGKGRNEAFSQGARQAIGAVTDLAPKVSFKELDLGDKLARQWRVERAPTMLFDPERYRVRWLGAPLGQEGQTFIEALIMMGFRETRLSDQAAKILKRIDSPREIKVFVSLTCPYCPQQAVNGLKAAIERPDLISLEIIDVQVNPDLAEKYSAHSTPLTLANDQLIAQGAQTEELFLLSLEKMEPQTVFIPDSEAKEVAVDLVIVGGGPAGLTAGIYAARSGLKSAVVERGVLGGQVALTPVVENYPGLTQVGGKSLVDIMVSHALEYVRIFPGEEVVEIKPGQPLQVLTSRRRFTARAVLLATGASPRRLDVPGEDRLSGRGVSYCSTCDGPLFKGKTVVMVGGGDSAVTEALHLKNIGVQVSLIHRRDRLRAQEHLVRGLEASQIPVEFNTQVREIKGRDLVREVEVYNSLTKKTSSLAVDGVFIAVGYEPASALARSIGAELTPEGYVKRDARHRTNVPGVYSAGDVEGGYKQIVIAAGQGAEAALAIFEDLVNPYWTAKPAQA